MDKDNLSDIISDDDLGLLDVKKKQAVTTSEDRLNQSFAEINEFIENNGREPVLRTGVREHELASRLKHMREDDALRKKLSQYDKHNLLIITKSKELETINDIFEDDDLGLLTIDDESIFQMKNVPAKTDRAATDFVARRKLCKDFSDFEHLFLRLQKDIESGENKLKKFEHGDIKQGGFFVADGIILYIESIKMELEKDSHGKEDGRLRCIFENGTESHMRFRTLQKSLEMNGRTIIDKDNQIAFADQISNDDQEVGYIYVLRSLSEQPKISNIENLFKIGYSSTSVEKRIQNAKQDPTYLMDDVVIVSTFRCFNMNPQRLERLLHRFFGGSRLDVEIIDKSGNRYTPSEWFVIPFNIIEQAIELILNGEIVNYKYDKNTEKIIGQACVRIGWVE